MSGQQTPNHVRLRGLIAAFVSVLIATTMAALVGIGYTVVNASEQSETNGRILQRVEDLNHRQVDCTEPGGKCYKRNQVRTREAIVGVNQGTLRIIVAALSCQADGITEQDQLARCTIRRAQQEESPQ